MFLANTFLCKKVLKKSTAELFKNVQPGDYVMLHINLDQSHRCLTATKALNVKATNLRTQETITKSIAQMLNCMNAFEFQNITEINILTHPTEYVWIPDVKNNRIILAIVKFLSITDDTEAKIKYECLTCESPVTSLTFYNSDFYDNTVFTDEDAARDYLKNATSNH